MTLYVLLHAYTAYKQVYGFGENWLFLDQATQVPY